MMSLSNNFLCAIESLNSIVSWCPDKHEGTSIRNKLVYLYPFVTREGDPAVRGAEDRSPGRRGKPAGALPWGSEWGVSVPHPDPPTRWYPHSQL